MFSRPVTPRFEMCSPSNLDAIPKPRQPDSEREANDSTRPPLWTRFDRTGRDGYRDRHQRRRRLANSIQLSPEQLAHILKFIYENEDPKTIRWTSEILFRYVPRKFESASVPEPIAASVLREALSRNLFRQLTNAHTETICPDGDHRIFEYSWDGREPIVPPALRQLPNLRLRNERPDEIEP